MIDRYSIAANADQIFQATGIRFSPGKSIYNASPTKMLPVVLASKPQEVTLAHWGFISSLSNNRTISPRLINLPVDQAFEKAAYQRMLATKRAIVLADGFYGWKQVSKKQKTPHYFYFKDRRAFAIGAVWEQDDFDPTSSISFNMLTTATSGHLRDSQEYIPLILNPEEVKKWLSPNATLDELRLLAKDSESKDILLHPVSPLITDPKNEGTHLIAPAQPSDQYGNYTLFN